jgi:NAD(P)-dependent dehydrogenase (short-subunit alcohol dehydrogenase family)
MPTVLVTGANRGLGLEFVEQYAKEGWNVIACCRDPVNSRELQFLATQYPKQVSVERMDVVDHSAIDATAAKYRGKPIDVLINNAGVIGPRREEGHRQRIGGMDYAEMEKVWRTNTMGPLKVSEAFLECVAASQQKKIVTISSTVGSNVEMKAPVYAYASSKAAVNKVMTLMAAALKDRGIAVAAFCPGNCKTRMGGPDANVEPRDSIAGMRKLIAGLSLANSGQFTRYNGQPVAF